MKKGTYKHTEETLERMRQRRHSLEAKAKIGGRALKLDPTLEIKKNGQPYNISEALVNSHAG